MTPTKRGRRIIVGLEKNEHFCKSFPKQYKSNIGNKFLMGKNHLTAGPEISPSISIDVLKVVSIHGLRDVFIDVLKCKIISNQISKTLNRRPLRGQILLFDLNLRFRASMTARILFLSRVKHLASSILAIFTRMERVLNDLLYFLVIVPKPTIFNKIILHSKVISNFFFWEKICSHA